MVLICLCLCGRISTWHMWNLMLHIAELHYVPVCHKPLDNWSLFQGSGGELRQG